uniref:hypothetical protein n=1 Tax=Turicimonas muris TaxID=1796652 RepID=UPI00321FF071
ITLVEISDCIRYFLETGLARDAEYDLSGRLVSFWLTHTGFYYFELEKSIKQAETKERIFNSVLFPILVSIITTVVTLLLSTLLG